ncbi:c-type cytochrome [Pontibacter sp. E15-1]|uniref:c-type cytochrome n=1 Tax=Pontibacter sp. E15-1 TaxID=2919918 RepID=UPI001F4FBADE|nr:cytochrome c [Pontibacter sp. E15-1]MCJ8163382.1 c-type cytochrome [Pontibacter sp. E15-1]
MHTKSKAALPILLIFGLIVLYGPSVYQTKDWQAPPEADKLTNPFPGSAEAAKSGKKLFSQNCTVCHGEQGKGDGIAAVSLNPHPKNLVAKKFTSQTDGAIFWKISEGRSPMPGYRNTFTEAQRWQLVNYIRTLKGK